MKENFCTFNGKRDEVLVAYLYGEMNVDEHTAFERHVTACVHCRAELDALGGVRDELGRWSPPEPLSHVDIGWAMPQPAPRRVPWLSEIPAWAQAAAAVLVLGVAASVANLEVRFAPTGVEVNTGWRHEVPVRDTAVVAPEQTANIAATSTPWHDEIVALEQDLRATLEARAAASSDPGAHADADDALLRRVRALIQDSERRQQSELALRVAEIARDIQTQRQADLVKIDRSLGLIQSRTGMEVMRTQRQVNSLAQQVSQRP